MNALMRYYRGLKKEQHVLLTHGDSVNKVADGFKVIATFGKTIAGENFNPNNLQNSLIIN